MNLILRIQEQEPFYFGYAIFGLCTKEEFRLMPKFSELKISDGKIVMSNMFLFQQRIQNTTDTLLDLTGRNMTDFLIKTFERSGKTR